ncbi:multidrug efflux MFS transporter [Vagococcus coleopterorum]|uniref:Multidrug efflux MFS transporter n=1 Tax=Vagococcus coleopterorum TaxID=2714946 RepID=A0A6G8ALC2_9ENTE|nr:MDR family MFS transporter [Vagococcus coleopterorum]QIL45759.1 multidrug efflux MFS transporter [Vagococcus coleopterorum]
MEHSKTKHTGSILAILLMGTFICNINQTLLNVALPKIMLDFNITASQGQWLSTGYMLVSGLMIPITAFLIERFKTRPLYIFSITMFLLGSVISGFAPSFFLLLMGRMVQAIGAGIIMPLMTVTLMNIYPAHKIGSIMGLIGIAMNFAPGVGPTFAGWVIQNYNWRFLFYTLIPFTLINLLMAIFFLKNVGKQKMLKFNISGVILSSVGLGCLLLGFSNAGDHPWLSFSVIGVILIGTIVTGLFIRQQLSQTEPMLNFLVFKSPTFTMMTVINFFIIMALYGGMLLLPLFLQNVRGVSPFTSGIIMLPGACFMAILSPFSGRLFDKYGAKPVAIVGISILVIGTFMFTLLNTETSVAFAAVAQTIRSIGLVLIMMPLQAEALKSLPIAIVAHGTAMFQTTRQIAGSIGTSVLITLMSVTSATFQKHHFSEVITLTAHQQQEVLLFGIRTSYIVTTILCTIALIMTIRLKPVKQLPAETFQK